MQRRIQIDLILIVLKIYSNFAHLKLFFHSPIWCSPNEQVLNTSYVGFFVSSKDGATHNFHCFVSNFQFRCTNLISINIFCTFNVYKINNCFIEKKKNISHFQIRNLKINQINTNNRSSHINSPHRFFGYVKI